MRILYLNADPGVPVFGAKGASVHVRAMAGALARAGHEVGVLASRTGRTAERRGGFLLLPPLAPPPAGPPPGSPAAEEHAMAHDRVHLATILAVAREFSPDLVYERYALWSRAGVDAARELGVPHVLEVNAPLVAEALRYRTLHHVDCAADVARHVFGATAVLLAVSEAVAEHARAHGAEPARVRIFPNGVDGAWGAIAPPRHAEGTRFTLGFCGSLRPWHGIEDLARIFVRVLEAAPDSRLLVVGDGPERTALERRLQRDRARGAAVFTGAVDHEEVPAWLARMDVALAPYPRLEPFYFSPLKLFEYQAAGLPVVVSRQGDLPRYVRDGETGFLHEPGDVAAAALCVLALRADPALARRVGEAARAEVLREHTWERRAAEFTALARTLAPHAGVRP
ncbi:MAG: glycosyltransferase family 4 protein [Candidatus Eisenbacteria bacterium]|nr:glycosyltransferase family 4 protein [Candidatus Eisenbacteria bacterium]